MSTVRVKICGITRGVDLQAAVAAGADALGFVFAQLSKRVLEPQQATDLVANAPAFVSRVGLFMDQGIDTISSILDRVPLNLLQFHGQESGGFCRRFGLPYIKALSMQSGLDVQRVADEYGDAAARPCCSTVISREGSVEPVRSSTGQRFQNCRFPLSWREA
jgi:phosphoribosylanthranilate isomerase